MNMPRVLRGQWAVVTGASSGIGLEFSRLLAQNGANVVMISNQRAELTRCAEEIAPQTGVETLPVFLDLATPEAPARVMDLLRSRDIIPLVLINNAGVFDFRSVASLTPGRIDLYIDLHIRTVAQLSRLMAMEMAEKGQGYILTMSSMSCWMPVPGIAMYSATKSFSRAFSRALSAEVRHKGVRVCVACPGALATGLFGLSAPLLRLGVFIGVITNPAKFVRRALRRLLKGRSMYINGWLNRVSIPVVASTPMWLRRWFARHYVK